MEDESMDISDSFISTFPTSYPFSSSYNHTNWEGSELYIWGISSKFHNGDREDEIDTSLNLLFGIFLHRT